MKRCEGKHAVSQLTVSDYAKYQRFNYFNQGKPINKQVKPFNFMIVGTGHIVDPETKDTIIPMMPYISPKTKKFEQIPYMAFVDYKTGKVYPESTDTKHYWIPISEIIEKYITHPESKLEGDTGILKRKHVTIDRNSTVHIVKETNELEESMIIGVDYDNYIKYTNIIDVISKLSLEAALKVGISRRSFST